MISACALHASHLHVKPRAGALCRLLYLLFGPMTLLDGWRCCAAQECQEGSASALQESSAIQEQVPLQEVEKASSLDGWNSVVSTR